MVTRMPEGVLTRNQCLVTTGVGFEPPSDPTPVVSVGAPGWFPRRTLLGSSLNKLVLCSVARTTRSMSYTGQPEAWFPRRTLLRFSVNRDNAVPRIRAAYAPHHGGQEIAQLASLLVQGIRCGVMVPG